MFCLLFLPSPAPHLRAAQGGNYLSVFFSIRISTRDAQGSVPRLGKSWRPEKDPKPAAPVCPKCPQECSQSQASQLLEDRARTWRGLGRGPGLGSRRGRHWLLDVARARFRTEVDVVTARWLPLTSDTIYCMQGLRRSKSRTDSNKIRQGPMPERPQATSLLRLFAPCVAPSIHLQAGSGAEVRTPYPEVVLVSSFSFLKM